MAESSLAQAGTIERESDRHIFMALRRKLGEYEPLRATRPDLSLDVRRGKVRVSGRVRTLAMKEIVGYLVKQQDGVTEVQNELISDTEVVRRVAAALGADDQLGPLCLIVDTRSGVVTLTGEVPALELESRAIDVTRETPGVADVTSEIVVRRRSRPPTAPRPETASKTAEAVVSGAASA